MVLPGMDFVWMNLAEKRIDAMAVGNAGSLGVVVGVLTFGVYADWNYWTTTGWEDYVVPHYDQGGG
jgi:hypothetical protein